MPALPSVVIPLHAQLFMFEQQPAGSGRAMLKILMRKQHSQSSDPGTCQSFQVYRSTQRSPAAFSLALLVLGSLQGSCAALMF